MLLEVARRELGQHDGSPCAAGLQLNDLELAVDALHGPADTKLPRSEIDVIPAQGEQLAAAKAGSQREDVQGFEPLAVDHLEQPLSLGEIQAHTTLAAEGGAFTCVATFLVTSSIR